MSNVASSILCRFDNVEQIKHAQFLATLLNDQATSCCRKNGVWKVADVERFVCFLIYLFIIYLCTNNMVKVM